MPGQTSDQSFAKLAAENAALKERLAHAEALLGKNGHNTHQHKIAPALSPADTDDDRREHVCEELARLLNSLVEGVYGVDLDGKCTYVNDAFLQLLGYEHEDEILGKHVHDLIHHSNEDSEPIPSHECSIMQALKSNKTINGLEEVFWKRDGTSIPVEARSRPIVEDGTVIGAIATFIDISDRIRADEMRREVEDRYRALFDGAEEGIILLSLDGKLLEVNEAFAKMHGYSHDELSQMDLGDLDTPETFALAAERIERVASGERIRFEADHFHKDGHIIKFEISSSPIQYRGQTIIQGFHRDITESKQAEAKLKQSEELLSLFISRSPVYSYIKQVSETESRAIYASDNFGQMLGILDTQIVGKTMSELFPSPFAEEILADDLDVVRNEKVIEREESLGGRSYVTTKFPLKQGDRTLLAGFTIDITDRKQAEAELRESEIRYRTLVDGMLDGVYRTTHEGRFVDLNQAMVTMFGYSSKEEMMQVDIIRDMYFDEADRQVEISQPHDIYPMRKKDGSQIWVEDHGRYTCDDDGNVLYHEGVLRDITERKRAEDALQASERRFRTVIEASPVPMAMNDLAGNVTYLNAAFTRTFGYGPGDIRTLDDWWPKAYPDADYREHLKAEWQKELERAIETETPFAPMEVTVSCKDGTERSVLSGAANLDDVHGDSHLVLLYDITDRKQAEEKLRKSEQRLRESQSIAKLGSYVFDFSTGIWSSSDILDDILGIDENFTRTVAGWRRLIHRKCLRKVIERISATVQDESLRFELEFKIVRNDNKKECWVSGFGAIERDPDGRPLKLIGTITDITERKESEAQLEQSKKILRAVLDNSPIGIWMMDNDGRMLFVNKAFCDAVGIPEERFLEVEHYAELYDEQTAASCIASDNVAIASPGPHTSYERLKFVDGKFHDLEIIKVMVTEPESGISGIVGLSLDITARKEAEDRLSQSEAALRESQQIAGLGTYSMDIAAGRWTGSDVLDRIFGIDQTFETSLDGWTKIIHPDDRSMMIDYFATNVIANKGNFDKEYRIVRVNDGVERWVHGLGRVEFDAANNPIRMHGTITDINERKQAEEALNESKRLLETIIDTIPARVFWKDSEMRYIGCNTAFARDAGEKSSADLFGKNDYQLSWDEFADVYRADDQEVLETGVPKLNFEEPQTTNDGVTRWLQTSKVPLCHQDGTVIGVLGVYDDITDRKQSEDALLYTKQLLERTNELARLGGWEIDLRTMERSWSRETCHILDLDPPVTPELRRDGTDLRFYHPDSLPIIEAAVERGMADGRPYDEEIQMVTAKGRTIWVREQGFFEMEAGRVVKINGIVHDITDRRKIEAELVLTEQSYSEIFNTVTEAIYVLDESYTFIDVNKGAENMYGYSRDELIGQTPVSVAAPGANDMDAVGAILKNVAETGLAATFEFWAKRKSGEVFPKEVILNRGEYFGRDVLIATARDITERKASEEALRESEERFSSAFEYAPIGMAMQSLDGKWLKANRALCELVGYTEPELLQHSWRELTHPDDISSQSDEFNKLLAGETDGYQIEKRYLHKNGSTIAVLLNVSLVSDEKRGPLYFVTQVQDLSEIRELEERFRQSQKMEAVGVLAGGIAHDFNNLLTVINGYSSLLLMKLTSNDELRTNVEMINDAGERAAELTAQLLAFSRKQAFQPRVLNLNSIIRETEKMLRRLIRESVDFRVSLDPHIANIEADQGQIEQILLNLAVNASDAMPSGGMLKIATSDVELGEDYQSHNLPVSPGRHIKLTVTDTGQGMSPETRARIFEPFFTTKEVGKGTGLGLSTVYGIVKFTGGDIAVESQIGSGTCFTIYLPTVADAVKAQDVISEARGGQNGTETVLLVEDEAMVRGLVHSTLTSGGFNVIEASSGDEALEICEKYTGPIHLLLTDMVMPKMSGVELKEKIVGHYPDIKVLFMSGYSQDSIGDKDTNPNIDFIGKPFNIAALARKVREMLDIKL